MRLIIVSNRLPVSVEIKKDRVCLKDSAGGVATGLLTYVNSLKKSSVFSDYLWVGWPGAAIPKEHQSQVVQKLFAKKLRPIFLSEEEVVDYYHGFSNDTIWPLFHYFPSYVSYDKEQWNAYRDANEQFAEAISQILKPGDVVWIHDYHLMLLPRLLRERFAEDLAIGFFLHIPFPVFEMFRLLPDKWRRGILNGILGADLVGFHTYDYTQYFVNSVQRLLGCDYSMEHILLPNRKVRVDTFPMGIDFEKFHEGGLNPKVQKQIEELKNTTRGLKLILSIDRLDYTKGILKRLQGYEGFLEKNTEWHEKVVLAIVVVPSRVEVERYQEMKSQIDELIGRINGRFGRLEWTPILYQFKSLSFEELMALYTLSDVALVTPLRDGMNLIAKEYVAARRNKTGVLILSEMAGTAQELGEALVVNPNHVEEITEALEEALAMPTEQQAEALSMMQFRLKSYNLLRWAGDFTEDLLTFKQEQLKEKQSRLLSPVFRAKLIKEFQKAKHKLLLLDYDGTLVPFSPYPSLARPTSGLLEILNKLAAVKGADVVLTSGRDKQTLEKWFKGVDLSLIAEHGIWIADRDKKWRTIKLLKNDWKGTVLPIVRTYVDRVPGSFLEEKEFAVVWHYRMANPELARLKAKELAGNLVNITANMDLEVMPGNKTVEIKNIGADKGDAALHFLQQETYDFVLAVGDDTTDEDLFKAVPDSAYSVKVGVAQSSARFVLDSPADVLRLLEQLAFGKKNAS